MSANRSSRWNDSKPVVAIVGDALIGQLYTEILFPSRSLSQYSLLPAHEEFNIDFSLENCYVQWLPRPGLKADDVSDFHSDIINCQAEVVLVHVGGNDICVGHTKAQELAQELINIAYSISTLSWPGGSVKQIVLCLIRPRFFPVRKWQDYNNLAQEVNDLVRTMSANYVNISQETARNFPRGKDELDVNKPEDIVRDGVHLGIHGMFRLYRSLQSTVVQSVIKVRQ